MDALGIQRTFPCGFRPIFPGACAFSFREGKSKGRFNGDDINGCSLGYIYIYIYHIQ